MSDVLIYFTSALVVVFGRSSAVITVPLSDNVPLVGKVDTM